MTRRKAPRASPWRLIIQLGEQLLETDSLAAQRDRILEAATQLVGGKTELWLDENLFRLPGLNQIPLFPLQPTSEAMRLVLETGESCCLENGGTSLAIPLKNKGIVLGVLQVERMPGSPFRKVEIESLEGMVGHIALALAASHRLEVERWRIEQLTLVRRVSAQIANILNLEELTRQLTSLIQSAFNYYYVAIFTLDPGDERLKFRSSAGPRKGRGRKRKSPVIEVHLGDGLIGSVAQSGKEAVVNDINTEPRFRFLPSLPATQSEVVLPLKIKKRILGVLDVQSDRKDAFHPNDLLVLRALADNIASAVDGAYLYSDLEKRARQMEMVAEVSNTITSILDLGELLEKVATLIHDRLGYPYVHLFTVHPNRRQIIHEAGSGVHSEALRGYVFDLDSREGIIPWVARSGEVLIAGDVRQEPRYRPSPFPPDNALSEMAVPMIYDNRVLGVLDLQSHRLNAFSEGDRFLFVALADNIATAIHNADLYQSERWRRQVADSLREVAGLLSAAVGVDDVLEAILKELERNLPCDVSAIWLLDGEELYLARIHGANPIEVESTARRWPETSGFLSSALIAEQPVIRKPTDPFGPTGMAGGFAADYSSIAAALQVGGKPLGVLTLSHHTTGRYGHEAQMMTATFANYAAVAIENARLYDSAQEQAYASAALLQVAQTAANSNSLEEILGSIVRITPILVGVEACAIYMWDQDYFRPAQAYGFPDQALAALTGQDYARGDFPLLDLAREQGGLALGLLDPSMPDGWSKPELPLTPEDAYYLMETAEQLLIAIPLRIKGDLFGVMLVQETSEARRFRNRRIEIINSIAQQVALAIQNEHLQQEMVARERLEHEVQVARQIQKTFLPQSLPDLPGWELAAIWKTARQVGGDFYDVFELPGRKLGLFVADVSDKGVPAALFMALTRTLMRAAVKDTASPAEALRRVNALMIPDNQQEMFVTAVYGVLSLESGKFIYANAGHPPPLLSCREDGTIESLRRTGAALGVIEDLAMEDRTIHLHPGNCLLLYTDGVSEAFSPDNELFGEDHLRQVLQDNLTGTAQDLLDTVESSVDLFMGSLPPADDITMLAVHRLT